jgi:arylsulfatase A-like enzyme
MVGLVLRVLEERFGERWALFVSADHGEAFGEHETREHAKTLYEELLHVPLLAQSPLFRPREIRERVGLIDLGPTILDLFGVETPATFHGQSLVPLLAGGDTALTRPLIAEGRLRRALTEPDGLKVIEDLRRKVVEVYDLSSDPGETRNLFDVEPARSDAALAELRAFFAVHAWREGGYEAPYKL